MKKITGIPFEEVMVPVDFAFADFLHSLFISYPEIPKNVPPGRLGFLLNGRRPETFDILKNGDRVELMVMEEIKLNKDEIKNIRKEIEFEISNLIQRYKINISLEEIIEIIFNERSFKDFHSVIDDFCKDIRDSNEKNRVKDILMKAWNFFPHRSLDGFCPIERISEFQKDNPYFKE